MSPRGDAESALAAPPSSARRAVPRVGAVRRLGAAPMSRSRLSSLHSRTDRRGCGSRRGDAFGATSSWGPGGSQVQILSPDPRKRCIWPDLVHRSLGRLHGVHNGGQTSDMRVLAAAPPRRACARAQPNSRSYSLRAGGGRRRWSRLRQQTGRLRGWARSASRGIGALADGVDLALSAPGVKAG